MIEAANHVATTARTLLTSMLAAGLTIAATMLASSDEALVRDSIEVVDAIGIKTRLSLIFLLVPVFFVFVHLNALMKLFLLYRRLGALEEEMVRRKISDAEKIRWRRLVHGFGFAQIHLPPENRREARDILHRCLQRFLMWVAIILAPVVILLTCQISFVRFQSAGITLVHQGLMLIDLAGLIWFHHGTSSSPTTRSLPGVAWYFLSWLAVIVVGWVSVCQAVPPSPTESAEMVRGTRYALAQPPSIRAYLDVLDKAPSGAENLLDGWSGLSKWSWSRRYLDVSRLTLINPDGKPDLLNAFFPKDDERRLLARQQSVALDFRWRTFHFANFSGAQVFAANFASINARKSVWQGARLDNASFDNATLFDASFDHAEMGGASLKHACLRGADLSAAKLTGSSLGNADLRCATLSETDLSGADINDLMIQWNKLDGVKTAGVHGSVKSCNGVYIVKNPNDNLHDIVDKKGVPCPSFNHEEFYEKHYGNYKNERESFLCSQMEAGAVGAGFRQAHRGVVEANRCPLR